MKNQRVEKDMIGEMAIPENALYGIHSARAAANFAAAGRPVAPELIHAFGFVKLACAITNHDLGFIDDPTFQAIQQACEELAEGELDEHFVTDALQGGAGTSTNMNVNEVIANRALQILGKNPGDYDAIHPIETVNLHQSTNDTYPTALKVAAIFAIKELEKKLVALIETFQKKEKELASVVKVGRTQTRDAVLTTLGREMGAYAEAIGRDRWRVFKCEERLRVVNLGGTAIGTGLGAPRQFIFKATENLRKLTGIGLARAENLVEATQNNDEFAEVAGILNACASNLMKIAGDIRFLSSGPEAGIGEINLPPVQAGSSIMPGKVNPVIPEMVTQCAIACFANCQAVTQAVSMGSLELNPFLPLVADKLLDTIALLTNAASALAKLCVEGITANADTCEAHVHASTATITALAAEIGYEHAQKLAEFARSKKISIKKAAIEKGLLSEKEFDALTSPAAVNKLGSGKHNKTGDGNPKC